MWKEILNSNLRSLFLFLNIGLFVQWRVNSNQYFGQSYYDLSKESWGWSWKERWVAVRPWEKPCHTIPVPIKKVETRQKTGEATNPATGKPTTVHVKPALSNGKVSPHARKSSKVSQEDTWVAYTILHKLIIRRYIFVVSWLASSDFRGIFA